MSAQLGVSAVDDINELAAFLAKEQAKSLSELQPIDCIVLCGSAILNCAESVFKALETDAALAQTLVICGGIGHSTRYLYETLARNARYKSIIHKGQGQPESRLLYKMFSEFFGASQIEAAGCRVLIEDQSTNCGANAVECKRMLARCSIGPRRIVIVQDPTMSLRTLASFEKAYSDEQGSHEFYTFPSFVPRVAWRNNQVAYDLPELDTSDIWSMDRFCDLLLGEIPRLRDNETGYGPNGKGFIAHVDIPQSVEQAWGRLHRIVSTSRAQIP